MWRGGNGWRNGENNQAYQRRGVSKSAASAKMAARNGGNGLAWRGNRNREMKINGVNGGVIECNGVWRNGGIIGISGGMAAASQRRQYQLAWHRVAYRQRRLESMAAQQRHQRHRRRHHLAAA
jgi:hypothetical protein